MLVSALDPLNISRDQDAYTAPDDAWKNYVAGRIQALEDAEHQAIEDSNRIIANHIARCEQRLTERRAEIIRGSRAQGLPSIKTAIAGVTGLAVDLACAQLFFRREPNAALNPAADRFLYLHGRNAFHYGKDELKKLRFDLDTGGLLLADACCGSKTFDKSFRDFIAELWADKKDVKLERIPPTDELFGKELNDTALTKVRCRREGADGRPEAEFREVDPYLEGVKVNGRWAVIYSKYDIGCALEKHQSTDCLGHDHASAVRLATAAVLYALRR